MEPGASLTQFENVQMKNALQGLEVRGAGTFSISQSQFTQIRHDALVLFGDIAQGAGLSKLRWMIAVLPMWGAPLTSTTASTRPNGSESDRASEVLQLDFKNSVISGTDHAYAIRGHTLMTNDQFSGSRRTPFTVQAFMLTPSKPRCWVTWSFKTTR